MTEEMKKMLNNVFDLAIDECPTEDIKKINELQDYITNLQKENTDLKKLCNKYEEEHKTTFETWEKVIARNEKAVEYIKNKTKKINFDNDKLIDVLNILQGGDE